MELPNKGLKKLQEEKRQGTINIIKSSIEDIHDYEGNSADITAKKLQEYTGLSRSALYKEHALKIWNPQLWEERYVEKTKVKKKLEVRYLKELEELQKEINNAHKQINKLEKKNLKLENDLEIERKRREVKEIEIEEIKEKNMKLLAECQRLAQIIHVHN
ncbi:DUF6262 family protein [Priestia filamentosa]|uniref:DUF6262 family protein n=1 Tax=Priestia filamentosa TaxID=1402861 RepID=UPI000A08B58E|nr:DUF6262 family protein [Priestia filamentosa]OXS72077.1 hypothetical protein B1B01_07105 [Priestia filamentosa]SMF18546.1 hypothetical protein SAMN06296056_1011453 [Priestia filamentosa]